MRIYLLVVFSIITAAANAQSHRFADSTAQWNVLERDPWNHHVPAFTSTYTASGDTLIKGKFYQRMVMTPKYQTWEDLDDYVRQDSTGKVFSIVDDTVECLIYDFGGSIGDTIIVNEFGGGWWSNPQHLIVESIDSVYIGRTRTRMTVRSYESVIENFIWIEGIGLVDDYYGHPFHPMEYLGVIDATAYGLLCFHENAEKLYYDENYDTCIYNIIWNAIEKAEQDKILLSPNPATSNFTLTLSQQPSPSTTLLIHDALGRVVKREELVSATQQISVADLPNGMYSYAVTQNSTRQASGKLVVSH